MKLLNYQEDGRSKLGIKIDQGILDVERAGDTYNQVVPMTIEEVIKDSAKYLGVLDFLVKAALEDEKNSLFLDENTITFVPAIPKPGKIICVGVNY